MSPPTLELWWALLKKSLYIFTRNAVLLPHKSAFALQENNVFFGGLLFPPARSLGKTFSSAHHMRDKRPFERGEINSMMFSSSPRRS